MLWWRLNWGDRALAMRSCCDWRGWLALRCKPWSKNHCRSHRTLEEHQLESQSQGCTCRPDSSLFQQHPRCGSCCMGCHGDGGGERGVTDRPGLTPALSHYTAPKIAGRAYIMRSNTSLQVSLSQTCLCVPWGLKGPSSPKGMTAAKKRGGCLWGGWEKDFW